MSNWIDVTPDIFRNIFDEVTYIPNEDDTINGRISTLIGTLDNKQAVLMETANKIKNTSGSNDSIELPGDINTGSDNTFVSAWDPRLGRVDGFLSNSGNKEGEKDVHPVIVPFASETAASAYFNMVFQLEKAAKNFINQLVGGGSENVLAGDAGYRVFTGDKRASLDPLRTDSNFYGVASIVNPYTLTKLCGALTVSSKDDTTNVAENRLYDIRDKRRFYDLSVTTDNDFTSINNPTTTNIITWSNKDPWGRTPYSFLDFVFCKYWNIIPNNRLITLRKYHAPVYDNLLFAHMYVGTSNEVNKDIAFAPIATVLTYFGEQTGNTLSSLMSFTTGTNWREIKSTLNEPTGDTGSNPRAVIDNMFTNGGGFTGAESTLLKNLFSGTNWLTGKMFSFGKFIGLLDKDGYDIKQDLQVFEKTDPTNIDPQDLLYSNRILGPVNRIDVTKARDAGIIFDLKMSITCEYVSRPIGGVNTKAAMLDILSNCMEIASVDAAFWGGGYKWMVKPQLYPFKNTKFKNSVMDDLYQGRIFGKDGALARTLEGVRSLGTDPNNPNSSFEWSNVAGKLKEFLGETAGAIGGLLSSVSSAIFGEGNSLSGMIDTVTGAVTTSEQREKGKDMVSNLLGNVNQMWRSLVIQSSMMPLISNMKSLLTGEPVGNWHLVVGNPLNPIMTVGNLICTDMKVEFSDELGPDDFPMEMKVTYSIEHGMAREKGSIQSMFNRGNGKIYELPDYIRASSDYETKVDDFTGNVSDSGWSRPLFMNNMEMVAKAGGLGKYKTYKMSPPKTLPTLANTDSTVITLFTPVDINAATSNIADNISAFGESNNNRAWIRGTAATRKLMN